MNSFERLMGRMNGREVDYLPNTNLIMTFAAKQIGVPYGKYVSDYRLLTKGVMKCYEKFGQDMLCVISDPMREAEGLGADVVIPEDGVPYSKNYRLKEITDINSLKIAEPSKSERMNDRLEAVSFLHKQFGNSVPVVGWVEGAVAESCDLMNISDAMVNFLDEPEEMEHLLEICVDQSALFAKEQIEAGADIIGIGDAASSLIGPSLYEDFALPFQQELIGRIHDLGAKVKLHICGNLNPVLELVAQSGADIIDLDFMVDMDRAAEIFPEETCICGNFDPVKVLLQGNTEEIRREVRRCMSLGKKHRNIISAGCEVPRDTPEENFLAVMKEIRGII